jgi:hypothetical protein
MKTLIVIFAVFAGSSAATSLILFLGLRKKMPPFLLSLLWAVSAVLGAGGGYLKLSEKGVMQLCLLALAWGFGALIPFAIAARKFLTTPKLVPDKPNPPGPTPLTGRG